MHCGIFADMCCVTAVDLNYSDCFTDVSDLRSAQRLQLNADKTELLWFCPAFQLRQLSSDSLVIALKQNVIKPSSVVLGVLFSAGKYAN